MGPLEELGVASHMLVLDRHSGDGRVSELLGLRSDELLQDAIDRLEIREGVSRVLFPWFERIASSREFKEADVVHWHLIHNRILSVLDLPRAFAAKPGVWTFHDSWAFTAHCIQPQDCELWQHGCPDCPHLDWPFPLPTKRSAEMWALKNEAYARSDVDIVVSTEHLERRASASPMSRHLPRIHRIPFGVSWSHSTDRRAARKALGIEPDRFVILVRANTSPLKGLDHLIEALQIAPPSRSVTILAVEQKGLLESLEPVYEVRDYGWADDDLYPMLVAACDVVLAPYPWAVGFGLMAVEAMAAGRPVVCFEGTSLADVTRAPEIGVAAHNHDAVHLRECIDRLMENPEECEERGRAGRALVQREYSMTEYASRLASLYRAVFERHHAISAPSQAD